MCSTGVMSSRSGNLQKWKFGNHCTRQMDGKDELPALRQLTSAIGIRVWETGEPKNGEVNCPFQGRKSEQGANEKIKLHTVYREEKSSYMYREENHVWSVSSEF